jgi:hypothetical protein
MKYLQSTLALSACLALLLAACDTSGVSQEPSGIDTAAKEEKVAICHVGNETVDDEAWPYCNGDGVCADAGTIVLVEVANPANHIGNPSHTWEGSLDYYPEDIGADGESTEDENSNGIADGCESPQACPCWAESELENVTSGNLAPNACSNYHLDTAVFIADDTYQFGFGASLPGHSSNLCSSNTLLGPGGSMAITPEQAASCAAQVVARCDAVGDPI